MAAAVGLPAAGRMVLEPETFPVPVPGLLLAVAVLGVRRFTHAGWFRPVAQPVLAVLVLVVGFMRLRALLVNADAPDFRTVAAVSVVVVFVVGFALARLTFVYAVPATLVVLVAWCAADAYVFGRNLAVVWAFVVVGYALSLAAGHLGERHLRREFVASRLLEAEREKSDRLLLNVLPAPIAARLKAGESPIADAYPGATVLFADLVGSTPLTARTRPEEFVAMLNRLFSAFNAAAAGQGIETTRTVGDGYMAVAGVPTPRDDHAEAAAELALAVRDAVAACRTPTGEPLGVRIGINTGPLVAAVVGTTRFAYDAWGDAVNTAARMESHGLPGAIQVTEAVYERLKGRYAFEARGLIEVKGKGPMPAYLLVGRLAGDTQGVGAARVASTA